MLSKKKGVTEGGEETDEGDMESWEVDYMSDASSVSDNDYKVSVVSCMLEIISTVTMF